MKMIEDASPLQGQRGEAIMYFVGQYQSILATHNYCDYRQLNDSTDKPAFDDLFAQGNNTPRSLAIGNDLARGLEGFMPL